MDMNTDQSMLLIVGNLKRFMYAAFTGSPKSAHRTEAGTNFLITSGWKDKLTWVNEGSQNRQKVVTKNDFPQLKSLESRILRFKV
jgi:hypothetical protein